MKNRVTKALLMSGVLSCLLASSSLAAELILPQNRKAFHSSESIEIAVAGLTRGEAVEVQLKPASPGASTLAFSVSGDGGTMNAVIPPRALAPGEYSVMLGGKETAKLTITSGVLSSTMLTSQTDSWGNLQKGGANFIVGNAFSFGLLGPGGQPLKTDLRGRQSQGMQIFERAVAMDLPTLVYMYWTGYVTHKPFGSEKSWANADMTHAMRVMSFHTAQRIRRYQQNILSVGTLDEPGLSWGKTAAGGSASGFPNWDEAPWYQARGWQYTDDPGARPVADWMKYMTTRTAILKEQNAQARKDLTTVWPQVTFSTDLYAPQAVMDGTDPLNQEANEIPSSHVFVDWGYGKAGVVGGVYLEKAHNPRSKLAHAMNGQLFGERVPQPQHRYAYHAMMNALLASGLHSNWWLNFGGMSNEDLNAVNEPARRIGPVFQNMTPTADTAVLWSFTEIAMRMKDLTAREAQKKAGEQIKLMIASWPEVNEVTGSGERAVNAYDIGGNYKEQVLDAHQAINRAGYPAHILHERILPRGVLRNYKTLVIVGQTFTLPADVQKAIKEFQARGGKVVVDGTTTQKFAGAISTAANFKDPYFRWANVHGLDPAKNPRVTAKQASHYMTNFYMDELARNATTPMKAALAKTASRPVFQSTSTSLVAERHAAGEGQMMMILNAHEQLPDIKDNEKYFIWNYALHTASYTLRGLPQNAVVYAVEGLDWKKASRLNNPAAAQNSSFAPGEMKLFLVAPRAPQRLIVSATTQATKSTPGSLYVRAVLQNLKMPWPLQVTVKSPSGGVLHQVYRATNAAGEYSEAFPIGANAAAGKYSVVVESLIEPSRLRGQSTIAVAPARTTPLLVGYTRIFDANVIHSFLAKRPNLVIAYGSQHQSVAQKLSSALQAKGVKARALPESEVMKKARYPRVWNPYARLYEAKGEAKIPADAEIKTRLTLDAKNDGSFTAKDEKGKDWMDDWKQPNSLVTVAGDGFVDFSGDQELVFEPGVQLYFNKDRQMIPVRAEVQQVQTTEEFKAKWSRPWPRLTSYVGGYQLPPQLPEAWEVNEHLIVLGDSTSSELVAALQASELLPQIVDAKYPGLGKALIQFAWSPFALDKNVIFIGASDAAGIEAGIVKLLGLV